MLTLCSKNFSESRTKALIIFEGVLVLWEVGEVFKDPLIKHTLYYNHNYEDLELCRNLIRDRDAGNKRAGGVEGTCSGFRKRHWAAEHLQRLKTLKGGWSGTQACQQGAARLPKPQLGWQDACLLGWSNELRINDQDKGSRKPQDWESRAVTMNCRC